MTSRVIIGLGSNIDPGVHIPQALACLRQAFVILGETPVLRTKPVGYTEQADFWNTAALIETALDADALRAWLKETETCLGRVRSPNKFGPRTIDLDILVWDGAIVDPDVYTRPFLQELIQALLPDYPQTEFNPDHT